MRKLQSVKPGHGVRSAGGFTILEILVAATLSVIILGITVGINSSVLRNWNDATGHLNRDAQLSYAENKLRLDLEQSILSRDPAILSLEASAVNRAEWSIRWLKESPTGVSVVEWACLPRDYTGETSGVGFSLFRFEVSENWEALYGSQGGLGSTRPSDTSTDWWQPFVVGNVLETALEVGVSENGGKTVLLEWSTGGTVQFPYEGAVLYLKPDYIKILLRVLSDEMLNEYASILAAQLDDVALERWLDENSAVVIWTFEILSD